ncbi:unnamed protein product [Protopolystoma xenopodis]|uniref:Uncharacterized protein n=1 Tax=Protopolystoma xenopodis TaxID=117903 RepID=A0A3S5CKK6_9PLAT|nr:unnamed protein product [Protopolystoma xenopodis]
MYPSCNLSEYEKKREEKRLRALETERQRMDSLLAHAELKAKASETRIQALNRLAEVMLDQIKLLVNLCFGP